ncbi:MAG: IspD/TarI family cytidylyltransferase, partial [Candidatus Cloacimonadota bacterium]|nr:IspD/TarI family cytidylyltransferase [Candidatus Cloacimonadota bacterium]
MKVSVIITAGGSGTRFSSNQKKQYYLLFGKPIIYWTITKFLKNKNISETIIVLPKNNFYNKKKSIQELFDKENLKFCIGGKTRQDSVYNGLKECVDTDIVMIHDGVRPFIDDEIIDKLIHICKETGSAIPGSRIVHTIKKINENNITDTVDRNELVQVYTP